MLNLNRSGKIEQINHDPECSLSHYQNTAHGKKIIREGHPHFYHSSERTHLDRSASLPRAILICPACRTECAYSILYHD